MYEDDIGTARSKTSETEEEKEKIEVKEKSNEERQAEIIPKFTEAMKVKYVLANKRFWLHPV